jgi:hypothetical protein
MLLKIVTKNRTRCVRNYSEFSIISNKRTFDEIESDSVLDMLTIELLLYTIVVGNLRNRDIAAIAQLNKGYKDILYTNKVYLQKLGYWTIDLKTPPLRKDMCSVRLLERPRYALQRATYKDADEDLIIIAYQNADLDTRIMAVYSSTACVKWTRGISTCDSSYPAEMVVSSLGIVLLARKMDKITVLDPTSGEETMRESKLPFVFDHYHILGSIAGRTVITNFLKEEYWIVDRNTKDTLRFERIETTHLSIATLNESSDYVVFKRATHIDHGSDLLLAEFPYRPGDKLIELGHASVHCKIFLRNNEVILAEKFNTRIIDATASIKEGNVHIRQQDIPTSVNGYKFLDVTDDANLFIYNKSTWTGEWYAWYNRAENTWTYTQLTRCLSGGELHFHVDTINGNVWCQDVIGKTIYRLGYNSTSVYYNTGTCYVQYIGSYKDTAYTYEVH